MNNLLGILFDLLKELFFRPTPLLQPLALQNIGFVMVRCVSHPKHARLWKYCYRSIRRYHPSISIVIIDDHSVPELISDENDIIGNDYRTLVVRSRYPKGNGEMLPLLYLHEQRWFDVAICIHDSVFLQTVLDETLLSSVKTVRYLWGFVETEPYYRSYCRHHLQRYGLNPNIYDQKKWMPGCFGTMCIIRLNFLDKLMSKFDLRKLPVRTRLERMCLERMFAILCFVTLGGTVPPAPIIHTDITRYMQYGITFDQFIGNKFRYRTLPLVKVWNGR